MRKNIGNNSHGNKNEIDFVESINGGLSNLNLNLKEFIKYICKEESINFDTVRDISAKYESDNRVKQDFYIFIDGKKFNISLKMGSGNSVHQEKCEDFISYIKKEFNASDEICDLWRFFLWADGTLDGTGSMEKDEDGNIKTRFNASEFKKKYSDKRNKLQNFLSENEAKLIDHFLFVGKHNGKVDYIYHGTPLHGSWISKEKILKYQIENSNTKRKTRSCLSVGKMSIQSWNISMKGTSEHKRGQIQVKYREMREDFEHLMAEEKENIGTFYGDSQEFNLTQLLNKNKSSELWTKLIGDYDRKNYFAVRVTNKAISKLSGKKVFPKSDAYIIKANIDADFLLKKEYVLTEDDLKDIDYTIVPDSGISIKLKNSKKYTIQKFTKDSFKRAFSPYVDDGSTDELLFSLLVYSNEKELYKNKKIANDLNIDFEKFIKSFKDKVPNTYTEKQLFDYIRKTAQDKVIHVIKTNKSLAEAIFTGKGWFDDPYYANYLFAHGNLTSNNITDFSVTTGSGRSKGKYNIEIKPKP